MHTFSSLKEKYFSLSKFIGSNLNILPYNLQCLCLPLIRVSKYFSLLPGAFALGHYRERGFLKQKEFFYSLNLQSQTFWMWSSVVLKPVPRRAVPRFTQLCLVWFGLFFYFMMTYFSRQGLFLTHPGVQSRSHLKAAGTSSGPCRSDPTAQRAHRPV